MTKKNNNEVFLEKFRECEQLIRKVHGDDKNFKWFEDKMRDEGNDSLAQKMYVCRVLRNYMSHTPDSGDFIEIPTRMLEILDMLKIRISEGALTCKKVMTSVRKFYTKSNTIKEIATALVCMEVIPIVDDDTHVIIGFCTSDTICRAIAKGAALDDDLHKYKLNPVNSEFIFGLDAVYDDVVQMMKDSGNKDGIIFINEDGTAKGALKGVIELYGGK